MNELLTVLPTFALSLGLTLLLEAAVALLFRMRGRDYLLFLLVNVLTNPAVVYLNLLFCSLFPDTSVYVWQLPLEVAVVVTEGFLYAKLSDSLRRPWLFAAVANGCSYGIGLIWNLLF